MLSGQNVSDNSLDPPTGQKGPEKVMPTLEDLYNRLGTGVERTKRSGGFTEPTAQPATTGHTIDEVMNKMPAADNSNGALPETRNTS